MRELPQDEVELLLREWCALNPRYDDEAFDRSVASVLDGLDDATVDRAGLGSLHRLAQANGYKGPPPSVALDSAEVRGLFKPAVLLPSPGLRATCGRFAMLDPLADDETPDPEWLIPDLLQCGTDAMLTGKPGAFKSFIALDLALSVAAGSRPGRMWPEIAHPGPVLFAAGEGGAGLKLRRRAWEQTYNDGAMVGQFIRSTGVPLVATAEDIAAFIAAAKAARPEGFRLVVIDTGNRAMQGQNPNATEIATALTGMCETIRRELAPADGHGCTVLVLHHPSHAKDAQDRPAGSHAFQGNADTALFVERDGKSMVVSLAMTKQKDFPEWEAPKLVALRQVQLSASASSLVVCPADQTERQAAASAEAIPTRAKHDPRPDPVVLDLIDRGIVDTLKGNTLHSYSTNRLAQILCARPDIELATRTLNGLLKTLREDKTRRAHRMFDPNRSSALGQWRYFDDGKGDPFASTPARGAHAHLFSPVSATAPEAQAA